MSIVRVAFLGTPDFARFHLQTLLEDTHFEVVGVVTQPDRPSGRHMHLTPSPVKELAQQKNIKVITPEKIKDPEVLKEIASWKAEAAVVVAYGQIVPQSFLDLFPLKVVNIHGSLLPRWRGAAPVQRAIQSGDKFTGVSLQVMELKLDAGAVIGSYTLPIPAEMNSLELLEALKPIGAKLLQIDLMDYLRGHITPVPQNENLVTYAHKIEKTESKLQWTLSAQELVNHIRAMIMGPGSHFEYQGRKIKLHRAKVVSGAKAEPGMVLDVTTSEIIVACGQDALALLEVQPESKGRMPVKDFLLGNKMAKGEKLK